MHFLHQHSLLSAINRVQFWIYYKIKCVLGTSLFLYLWNSTKKKGLLKKKIKYGFKVPGTKTGFRTLHKEIVLCTWCLCIVLLLRAKWLGPLSFLFWTVDWSRVPWLAKLGMLNDYIFMHLIVNGKGKVQTGFTGHWLRAKCLLLMHDDHGKRWVTKHDGTGSCMSH